MRSRIPVTVIGGFLGAGKTTLLNRLLTESGGQRIAVLVNDFGAINIDAALIEHQNADVVALTNGCVCCQIGGDLTDALIAVIDAPRPVDAIVIEASGVSDPWKIAQVSVTDPALTLDRVLVLIDATTFAANLSDAHLHDTVLRQVQAADLLVVNKCDVAGDDQLVQVRAILSQHAPNTIRTETSDARLPEAMMPLQETSATRRFFRLHPPPAADHGALFLQLSFRPAGIVDADRLRALLRDMPAGVLRCKGVVQTNQGLFELQFAGRHGSLRRPTASIAADDRALGLVVIAMRHMTGASVLAAVFEEALLEQSDTTQPNVAQYQGDRRVLHQNS